MIRDVIPRQTNAEKSNNRRTVRMMILEQSKRRKHFFEDVNSMY